MRNLVILVAIFLFPLIPLSADTWYVDDDGVNDPGPNDPAVSDPLENGSLDHPYDMIQEAIDAAANGDLILVLPGSYVENIDNLGKTIDIRSDADGDPGTFDTTPESTHIDGNQTDTVVRFQSTTSGTAALQGFTITNGLGYWAGAINCGQGTSITITDNIIDGNSAYHTGGIICNDSDVVINNNSITNNEGNTGGGGLNCYESTAVITNNIISGNTTNGYGGGISCWDNSTPTIAFNVIDGNSAINGEGGGIRCCSQCSPTITGNIIKDNIALYGGGIGCSEGSSPIITNNIITGNEAYTDGGGIDCYDNSDPAIINNTIVENKAQRGSGISYVLGVSMTVTNTIVWGNVSPIHSHINHFSGTLNLTYCDVEDGWPGTGNIDANPQFENMANKDYHLTITSPCIDAGDNSAIHLPAEDYEGDPRRHDIPSVSDTGNGAAPVVDMGADECTWAKSLEIDVDTISASTGGVVQFSLNAGTINAYRSYFLLGSVTGTVPGTHFPNVTLPLNWDIFTIIVLDFANTPLFANFNGMLGAQGDGQATLNTISISPLSPDLVGTKLYFAYLLYNPKDYASDPVVVEIVQ